MSNHPGGDPSHARTKPRLWKGAVPHTARKTQTNILANPHLNKTNPLKCHNGLRGLMLKPNGAPWAQPSGDTLEFLTPLLGGRICCFSPNQPGGWPFLFRHCGWHPTTCAREPARRCRHKLRSYNWVHRFSKITLSVGGFD